MLTMSSEFIQMPKYKRKKETKYSLTDLIEAVENVRQKKMNSYEASVKYEIPRSTIIHRLYGTRGAKQPTPGRPPELSKEWETKVASDLHVMEKCGYPLTPKEVKILISNYIRRNGIVTRFKDDYPGKEWFRGFKRRHKLSLKKPQAVEVARKKACNPFTVYNYFELLERTTQELGLTDKPQCIYNLDETSFCSDPIKTKVVGLTGFPSTRTTGSPGRNNTSVLLATNALGEKIPPLIIFQGKHLWTEWLFKNENVNTAYAVSHKGWMETTIFEQYIKSVFLPAIGPERPILLVYDGHSTHVDLSVIELLVAEQITVLKLPAHSSHLLQPLDCSTMKPMKDKWDGELVKWQRLHVGAKLPKQEFAKILTMIWDDLNPVIIQNGFRKTGIHPLNRNAIPKEKFDNLSWLRWEEHLRQQNEQCYNDADHYVEENLEGSYTQKDDSRKENKVPTLISVCLKIINGEILLLPDENNPTIANIRQDMKVKNIPTEKENEAKASRNISKKVDMPIRKSTQTFFQNWETVKDPKSFILSRPKNTNANSNRYSCNVKILENIVVEQPKNKNKEEERISFEELLLQTISRNDMPKTSRKRISQGAEILTYRDALHRLRKEKEEKEKAEETKLINKLKRVSNNNNKKPRKNKQRSKTKANKNKKRKNLQSDSESDCSYISMNSSEDEDFDVYLQSVLEESIDEDLQEPLPSTSRGQKATGGQNFPKLKSERLNERRKKIFKQKEKAVNLSEEPSILEENWLALLEPLPSISRDQEENILEIKSERVNQRKTYTNKAKLSRRKENEVSIASEVKKDLNVGDFILAKFQSIKGKRTYKYVCHIEEINQEKIVVKGLKAKKDNKEFRFVENDISIIEKDDVISYLPKAVLNTQKDTVIFPYKVEVFECK